MRSGHRPRNHHTSRNLLGAEAYIASNLLMWVLLHQTAKKTKALTMPSKTLWSTSGDRPAKKQSTPRGRHLQGGVSGTPNPSQRTGQKAGRETDWEGLPKVVPLGRRALNRSM